MSSRIFLFILFCAVLAPGCREEKHAPEALIRSYVDEKLHEFENQRMEACRAVAFDNAAKIVDSLLIERARLEKDTLGKPPKPEKPLKPEIKTPLDSSSVKPLFGG